MTDHGAAQALANAGLGLDYTDLRLERTCQDWVTAGLGLASRVGKALDGAVTKVEAIGSSSVLTLLAKPIVDLAVGLDASHSVPAVTARLEPRGWIYRGDAGEDGGHVYVLETRPWHRVAHLHVVTHGGVQWRDYLRFRDLLRSNRVARERYEQAKVRLADQHPTDRVAYTTGKTETVQALLNLID